MFLRFAMTCLLLVPLESWATEPIPAVIDNAHLFEKPAIERIGEIATDLKENHGLDLCLETMKEPTGVSSKDLRKMRNSELFKKLRYAAQERADQLGVDGIYVMITTDPKHVTVVGWPEGREQSEEVSSYKREQLRKKLAWIDMQKKPDETLIRAIEHYRALVREPARPSPLQTMPAIAIASGLLGVWLFLRLLNSRNRDRRPIYQPAMLGSIFGAPAGFWINDRLFDSERPSVVGPENAPVAKFDVSPEGIIEADPFTGTWNRENP